MDDIVLSNVDDIVSSIEPITILTFRSFEEWTILDCDLENLVNIYLLHDSEHKCIIMCISR